MSILLFKNKYKLYKNINLIYDYENGIIYKDDEIIGQIVYKIEEIKKEKEEELEIKYRSDPFLEKNGIDQIKINVNCINIYFNLNFRINRQRFYNELIKMNYICNYKPETYAGLKLIFKYKIDGIQDGHCKCDNKCTCKNITFLIFQTGNVIVTGFQNQTQINNCIKKFNEIIEEVKPKMQISNIDN